MESSLVTQLVKYLPVMQETLVQFLGWEDPLEEIMATHSRILAWRIPMDRGALQATVYGVTMSWTRLGDSAAANPSRYFDTNLELIRVVINLNITFPTTETSLINDFEYFMND